MGKTGKILIALAVVVVIAGGSLVVMNKNATRSDGNKQSSQSEGNTTEADVIITYDGEKFEPATVTVKSGGKVKVVNSSDQSVKFNSNPHPLHTNNSELNVGEIKPGESATMTLTEKGSWGFHNHLSSKQSGTITVE